MNRRGVTRIELVIVAAIVLVCSGLLGFWPLLEIPFRLIAGWALHLVRLAKELVFDANATATAVVALLLFVGGLHLLAKNWRARSRTSDSARPWSWRWTLGLAGLILCLAVAGIAAVGIAHQIVWLATAPEWFKAGSLRIAVARTQSSNNLKQIGLAASEYHEKNRHLPPGATFDADARPMHSWATLLLPYIEQDRVFKMVRLDLPWNHPENQKTFENKVYVYTNPFVPDTPIGLLAPSHYAANVHLLGATPRRLADIADGTPNTILFGEAAGNFKPWGQPLNWRDPALGINTSPHGFGNPGLPAAQFVMADGSVRYLNNNTSPAVLKALATPAGGERLELPDE